MNNFLGFAIGFFFGFLMCVAIWNADVKETKEQSYKQGQIDCIEGRVIYQPDTTTNYIKIEP